MTDHGTTRTRSASRRRIPRGDFEEDQQFMQWLKYFQPDWESEYSGNIRGMYCAFSACSIGKVES